MNTKLLVSLTVVGALAVGAGGLYLVQKFTKANTALATAPLRQFGVSQAPKEPLLDPVHARWKQEAVQARGLFDEFLTDYPSARFKTVIGLYYWTGARPTDYVLCGLVNSKNRMGAYTGYKNFAVVYTSSKLVTLFVANDEDDIIVNAYCSGKGNAGLVYKQQQAAERAQTPTWNSLKSQMEDFVDGRVKPFHIIPSHADTDADFSDAITWSPSPKKPGYDAWTDPIYAMPANLSGERLAQLVAYPDDAIEAASRHLMAEYSQGGTSGAQVAIDDCYMKAKADADLLNCIGMDGAGEVLFPAIESTAHYPPTEYFVQNIFEARVRANLAKHGITDSHDQLMAMMEVGQIAQADLNQIAKRNSETMRMLKARAAAALQRDLHYLQTPVQRRVYRQKVTLIRIKTEFLGSWCHDFRCRTA